MRLFSLDIKFWVIWYLSIWNSHPTNKILEGDLSFLTKLYINVCSPAMWELKLAALLIMLPHKSAIIVRGQSKFVIILQFIYPPIHLLWHVCSLTQDVGENMLSWLFFWIFVWVSLMQTAYSCNKYTPFFIYIGQQGLYCTIFYSYIPNIIFPISFFADKILT